MKDALKGAALVLLVVLVYFGAAQVNLPGNRGIICPTEDSPHCLWIGPLQGNGQGAVVWNGGDD